MNINHVWQKPTFLRCFDFWFRFMLLKNTCDNWFPLLRPGRIWLPYISGLTSACQPESKCLWMRGEASTLSEFELGYCLAVCVRPNLCSASPTCPFSADCNSRYSLWWHTVTWKRQKCITLCKYSTPFYLFPPVPMCWGELNFVRMLTSSVWSFCDTRQRYQFQQ